MFPVVLCWSTSTTRSPAVNCDVVASAAVIDTAKSTPRAQSRATNREASRTETLCMVGNPLLDRMDSRFLAIPADADRKNDDESLLVSTVLPSVHQTHTSPSLAPAQA